MAKLYVLFEKTILANSRFVLVRGVILGGMHSPMTSSAVAFSARWASTTCKLVGSAHPIFDNIAEVMDPEKLKLLLSSKHGFGLQSGVPMLRRECPSLKSGMRLGNSLLRPDTFFYTNQPKEKQFKLVNNVPISVVVLALTGSQVGEHCEL